MVKKRIYPVLEGIKRRQIAYQIYVNSRSLTRDFMSFKTRELIIPHQYLSAYLAGRIDGDGHVDTKHRSGIRIAYSNFEDAFRDQKMFGDTNVSLYEYKAARTFVLYLKKKFRDTMWNDLSQYCLKLVP